jgi:hypothetical protein
MHMSSQNLPPHVQDCIDACTDCHHTCKEVLFQHCLEVGGRNLNQRHVNLMVDCIEICELAASLLLRGSKGAADICALCADTCNACATSCEDLRDEETLRCAETCRSCADMCRDVGGLPGSEGREEAEVAA